MTRKDYQALAQAIISSRATLQALQHLSPTVLGLETALAVVISEIGDVLAADNPRFDRDKWDEACQGEK